MGKVPEAGFEPATHRLQGDCSTVEPFRRRGAQQVIAVPELLVLPVYHPEKVVLRRGSLTRQPFAAPGKKECSPPLTGSPRRQEGGVPRELQGTARGHAPMEEVRKAECLNDLPRRFTAFRLLVRQPSSGGGGLRPFYPPVGCNVWVDFRDWGLTDGLVSLRACRPSRWADTPVLTSPARDCRRACRG